MSKRRSESSRVIAYFQSAPADAAEAIFGVIQGIMKERRPPRPKGKAKERKVAAGTGRTEATP